jgi:glycerol-3-phosphate acyltransferase PlsX
MRIGMDAMGGDHAPREIVRGVLSGLRYLEAGDEVLLYGDEGAIAAECKEAALDDPRVRIVHCTQHIGMNEPAVEALRAKRDSSIYRMAIDAGSNEIDSLISAGHTGAFVAACQLKVGSLKAVARPGIAIVMPTFYGPVVICDVGANVAPKPHHLYEYAVMCACYARMILGKPEPRVGLMSIGEEDAKGNPLVKEARAIMKDDPNLRFAGNIEGRDVFNDVCDIAICDGFVGNVILKLTEGLAEGLFKTIVKEIKDEGPDLLKHFEPIVDRIWKRHDFAEYGGAPLLGLRSVAIICHGRSDARAISNGIRVATEQVRQNLAGVISETLKARREDAA